MSNQNQKRGRHRNSGGGNNGGRRGNPARQNFDSNGPNVRIRGNATQVYEKYIQLARDAQQASDRVLAENLLQHAEHYYRILNVDQGDKPQGTRGDQRIGGRQQPQATPQDGPQSDGDANGNGADKTPVAAESEIVSQTDGKQDVVADENAPDADGNSNGARRPAAKRGRGRGRPPRRHQATADTQDGTGEAAQAESPGSPDADQSREAVGAD